MADIYLKEIKCKEDLLLFSRAYMKGKIKVNSKTNLYHQAGNSIVVDVMYYILKNILN